MRLEQTRLDELLPHLNGIKLLCLGDNVLPQLIQQSQIPMRIWAGPGTESKSSQVSEFSYLPCDYQWLPLPSGETDVAIVHHVLEHDPSAHGVLRELTRVIKPYGYLLLLCFNAQSSWGLRAMGSKMLNHQSYPWRMSYWAPGRLYNALDLLGFEIRQHYSFAYHLPFNMNSKRPAESTMSAWQGYGGAVNLVLAQKNVRGMTPLRSLWRPHSSLQTASIRETIAIAKSE